MSATSFSLQLLGSFVITLDGQPVKFRTKKTTALLIFLATQGALLPNSTISREALLDLLWPNYPEKSARQSLRTNLFYLRKAIPELPIEAGGGLAPLLLSDNHNVWLNKAVANDLDLVTFNQLLSRSQVHKHVDLLTCAECQSHLQQAVELYRGDFITDFYLRDSLHFEEWVLAKRAELRRKVLDAMDSLSAAHLAKSDLDQAESYARRQLAIENLRESAHRQLMESLAMSGRRSEALEQYENLLQLLAEELGVEPSHETISLWQDIRAGEIRARQTLIGAPLVRGYELGEQLGVGNFGAVHRAYQPAVKRDVAIKIILPHFANQPDFIRRFEVEAQLVAQLEHPHIVPLYDYWRGRDGAYLIMRWLRGGSLRQSLEEGPWEPEATAQLLDQLAGALSIAHAQGIVHRDIKPENILLDESGNAYLSDFGIAKNLASTAQLTGGSTVMGSPDYNSPEQILNEAVGPQSDLYSLGAVLFEMLTGEKPYGDAPLAALLHKHLDEPVPLVSEARHSLPTAIDDFIQRAMAKRPNDRYANVWEMAEVFRTIVHGSDSAGLAVTLHVGETYNPYKGLRAFLEADAEDFFGREALVEQLIRRVVDTRFLAVVGPSGSGKSSVVKAGLIPALRGGAIPPKGEVAGSDKWFVAEMVPGTHPLEELELALWPVAVNPPSSLVKSMQGDTRGMLRTIRRILPEEEGAHLLLVIDQFEELFTLVEDKRRRQFFIDSLIEAVSESRAQLRVIITMRADFYDRPLQELNLGKLIKENNEIVLPLSPEELNRAVREPARRVGVGLEEDLVAAIVTDVSEQPGALPLLQYALTELYERRQNEFMSAQSYKEIGGVLGALSRRASEIYDDLDSPGQEATRQLFLRLVTLGQGVEDTRRRVRRSELEGLHSSGEPEDFHAIADIIDQYGAARILTFDHDPTTREPTVEVAHEALLRRWEQLRGWLDDNRSGVRLQRMLAASATEWLAADRDESFLLRGSRLDQFENWYTTTEIALTNDELVYLETSSNARQRRRAEEQARQRRELETAQQLAETERRRAQEQTTAAQNLRRRAVYLGLALVMAVSLAVTAVGFGRQSAQNADLAATRAMDALTSAELAASREADAVTNANIAATQEALAQQNAVLANTRQEEAETQRTLAQAETEQRAIAQAAAEQEAHIAFSRELAAAALANLDDDPERSILLAMQAISRSHTIEAEAALRAALQSSRVRGSDISPILDRATGANGNSYASYSPDGSLLFTSGNGGAVMRDMTANGQVVFTRTLEHLEMYSSIYTGTLWINRADFSPNGSMIAFGHGVTDDSWVLAEGSARVTILAAKSGETVLTFPIAGEPSAVLFSPDGTKLITAGFDGSVAIWDLFASLAEGTGVLILSLPLEGSINGMSLSPDSQLLALALGWQGVAILDVNTGENVHEMASGWLAFDIDFSPDGRYIAAAGGIVGDGDIRVWDARSGQLIDIAVQAHDFPIRSIDFSHDGTKVSSAGADFKARIWEFSDGHIGQNLFTLSGHVITISQAPFSPDDQTLVTVSRDGVMRIWDVSTAGFGELGVFDYGSRLDSLSLNPDGDRLAAAGEDGTVIVWEVATGALQMRLDGHTDAITDVEYSPDGRYIVTTSVDASARIWDAQTGGELWTIDGRVDPAVLRVEDQVVNEASFSPDGQYLAIADQLGMVTVWDMRSREQVLSLTGHVDRIMHLDYSPNGALIATAGESGTIKIWRAEDGQELWSVTEDSFGFATFLVSIAFAPEGDQLVTAQHNGEVILYQLPSAEGTQGKIEVVWRIQHESGRVSYANFSPDGRFVIASGQRRVAIRDATNGEVMIDLIHPLGAARAIFSADGRQVLTAGTDGYVRIFAVELADLLVLAQSRVTRQLTEAECQQYLHVEACPGNE